jgi:hypothetical protein
MIRLLLLVFLALASPLRAETARVYSGEHGGFTRLVIELPSASDWTVGRTTEGYAFAATAANVTGYDLATVWQRIARTRVTAIDADPEGALRLTLGCDCHVFPFEYRPGVVVLDIKPGPAPQGSVFEANFAAPTSAPAPPASNGLSGTYNWIADLPTTEAKTTDLPLPLSTGDVSLEPIRDALLEQIARGAADGIVDIGPPLPAEAGGVTDPDHLPWSSIHIGERPGILVTEPEGRDDGPRSAETCAADDLLDLAAWGEGETSLDLLAKSREGLYGEFDAPEEEAILQSVRALLYLGFGAEAAQQAKLSDLGAEDETLALYRSIARLVDGESDPETPFSTMLDCDGPAALWAALARDRLPPGAGVNRDAILRAFLALPPHLRVHLGSPLAEKFLAHGDADAARVIRDSMDRAPTADPGAVALLDAESELHNGDAEAARDHALEAVALDGNEAEGLVALVETHVRQLDPIDAEVPAALTALRGEIGESGLADSVDRAIVLSLGLSGQTEAAFDHRAAAGKTKAELWRVVQARAPDDDFLRFAVLPPDAKAPDVTPELALDIARRLSGLGFPDAAIAWLGNVLPTDAPDRRLVASKAELDRGAAQRVIDLLSGLPGPEADALRAEALVQLGDLAAAEALLTAAGETEAALRAELWQEDWSSLDPTAPDAWQAAAGLTVPSETGAAKGLLGRGEDAVAASEDARTKIEALLGAVAVPDGG